MATKKNMPPKIKEFLQKVGDKLSAKKANQMPKEFKQQQKQQVVQGLKKAAPIVGAMGAATAVGFRGKTEAKLENKSNRQAARATRKENRAANVSAKAPNRAERLMTKATSLRAKSAANAKAAEVINKSKMK